MDTKKIDLNALLGKKLSEQEEEPFRKINPNKDSESHMPVGVQEKSVESTQVFNVEAIVDALVKSNFSGEKAKAIAEALVDGFISNVPDEEFRKINPNKERKMECPEGYEVFNEDWYITPEGDMVNTVAYDIPSDRLEEDDWILHCMGRNWFDANTFLPAYFEACRRAGIKVVQMRIDY